MNNLPLTHPAHHNRAQAYLLYLLWLLAVSLLGYLLVFPLVMFPQLGFDRWGGSKWAPVLDYSYGAKAANADIVIFGDSSAFLGIDPKRIDSELGTHTIVLPNTVGSLQVTGDLALRRYLALHRPPRAIVFYFTPWNLDFRHSSPPEFLFEGEEMLLRNGSLKEIASFASHHPKTFLEFPFQVNALLDFHAFRLALSTDRRQQVIAGRGHMEYTDPIGPLTPPCKLPIPYLRVPETASIAASMHQYATPQTRVFLYLSPIPACNNASEVTMQQPRGVEGAGKQTLPPGWFAADGMYAHILPKHVMVDTELFVNALRSWNLASGAEGNATHIAAVHPL